MTKNLVVNIIIYSVHPDLFCLSVFCAVDVAIGAPEEDDYGGAVYIYQGDATGIVKKYSMVIKLFISIFICIVFYVINLMYFL